MARVLTLTTPHMRGDDVRALQKAINNRDRTANVDVDGEYGPATDQAARSTAWLLGVEPVAGSTTAGRRRALVIQHPGKRTKAELNRAEKRVKAREAAGKGLAAALKWAADQEGTKEKPAGSNRGPKITAWQAAVGIPGGGAPWCGAFAHAVARVYGVVLTQDVRYCPWIRSHALAGTGGLQRWTTSKAEANAALRAGHLVLVVYDFGGSTLEHVGVAKDLGKADIDDYEGNTSFQGKGGSQSNGGCVAHRTDRDPSLVGGYAIVRKPS